MKTIIVAAIALAFCCQPSMAQSPQGYYFQQGYYPSYYTSHEQNVARQAELRQREYDYQQTQIETLRESNITGGPPDAIGLASDTAIYFLKLKAMKRARAESVQRNIREIEREQWYERNRPNYNFGTYPHNRNYVMRHQPSQSAFGSQRNTSYVQRAPSSRTRTSGYASSPCNTCSAGGGY